MIGHHTTPGPPPRDCQDVLNRSWPLRDENGKPHARGIPDKDRIPVRVRIVFERDGETWLDGTATRWHGRSVYVEIGDRRHITVGVWIDAGDVRRR